MEFSFEALVKLDLEHTPGSSNSKHVGTSFRLDVGKPLDESKYLDKDTLPTKDGAQVLSNVLVQGLVANIHYAHDNGFRDSAEHLRWIISELEKGFAMVATGSKSTF